MRLPLSPALAVREEFDTPEDGLTNALVERTEVGEQVTTRPGLAVVSDNTGVGRGLVSFNGTLLSVYGATLAFVDTFTDYAFLDLGAYTSSGSVNGMNPAGTYFCGGTGLGSRAALWGAVEGLIYEAPTTTSVFNGVAGDNVAALVVGGYKYVGGYPIPHKWTQAGGLVSLPTLGGPSGAVQYCCASKLVGYAAIADPGYIGWTPEQAASWDLDGNITALITDYEEIGTDYPGSVEQYLVGVSSDGTRIAGTVFDSTDDALGTVRISFYWDDGAITYVPATVSTMFQAMSADGGYVAGMYADGFYLWTRAGGKEFIPFSYSGTSSVRGVAQGGTAVLLVNYNGGVTTNYLWTRKGGVEVLQAPDTTDLYALSGNGRVAAGQALNYSVGGVFNGIYITRDPPRSLTSLSGQFFDFAQSTL